MSCKTTFITGLVIMSISLHLNGADWQIPVADLDNWVCEYYMGGKGGIEGPRKGHGIVGPMAFDAYGNAFVAGGSIVTAVTTDDQVHLVAGIADLPGAADGSADQACLAAVNAIACHPTEGSIYVSDIGNMVIKKISLNHDGKWFVTTVAGQVGKSGHQDGASHETLLQRVDGIALDSKGNLYMADQDWLRRLSPDGQLVTLNPKGGSGGFGPGLEHELTSVRFNRIMGAGQLACDEHDDLFIGDKWNGTWLKIDFKAGKAIVIAGGPARGQPGFRDGTGKDGAANTEAIFHTGGGPSALAYDRLTRRLYTCTADEHAIRAITPDGMVQTLGPWYMQAKGRYLSEGPLKKTSGAAGLAGCDPQGRVYAVSQGLMYRFLRNPAIEGAPALKTPNLLLPWKASDAAATVLNTLKMTLFPPATNGSMLTAGKPVDCAAHYRTIAGFNAEITVNGKTSKVAFMPRAAALGASAIIVSTELIDKPGEPPICRVKADWSLTTPAGQGAAGKADTIEIAPSGGDPVVISDGTQFVVVYNNNQSIYAKRISVDGKVLDAQPIKLGGQWEYRPAVAFNGNVVVVTGARRPNWNPWGWNGPGAISIGRLTSDGKTPERFAIGPIELANGGFAGLLDRSQWKGRKGWPEGIPGGFKDTENGYWPSACSTVCWDGQTWVTAWVRAKVRGPTDLDIFACRVDAATMMPIGEPVLVGGGSDEPGVQTQPSLIGLGNGSSALVYLSVKADGQVRVMSRLLSGGPTNGPARVEPREISDK